jgi:SHS2 domain-containing protein
VYEYFDHTADVGLRVRAGDRESLFADAGRGLSGLLVDRLPREREVVRSIELDGAADDLLLFDWLSELLYAFDTEQLVFGHFTVRLEGQHLSAEAAGRRVDPEHDRLLHEVKAVTYHGLKVERTASGWLAEVILDI